MRKDVIVTAENKRAVLGRAGAYLTQPVCNLMTVTLTRNPDSRALSLLLDWEKRHSNRSQW